MNVILDSFYLMKIMTMNKEKSSWFSKSVQWLWGKKWWIIVFISFLAVFFVLMPFVLKWIQGINIYGVDNAGVSGNVAETGNHLDKFGLYGDSYGIWNAFFSALAFFGVVYTLWRQNRETAKRSLIDQYYKMLDFQQTLIDDMAVPSVSRNKTNTATIMNKTATELKVMEGPEIVKGRKSFVEYKAQLKYLMKAVQEISVEKDLNLGEMDIADIAYAVFYYGAGKDWKPFMHEYLKDYEQKELLVDEILVKIGKDKKHVLGRTNQNYMSVYSRNMYNAIKLIDQTKLLTDDEKVRYVKVLRAQLSNAELYVLFFNLLSRFGKKWIANNYVVKYELIQNLPSKYCDGYDPKRYFPEIKFEGEEQCLSPFTEQIVPREKQN